jgi:RND superfamily putative drug exporter
VHKSLSARWADATSRHPVRNAILGFVIMIALTLPARSMELGFTNDGQLSPELTQRQAYDLLAKEFGVGINGPLVVAVDLPPVTSSTEIPGIVNSFVSLVDALKSTSGVADVSVPLPNNIPTFDEGALNPGTFPTAAIVSVQPSTSSNDQATTDLVNNLRGTVIPNALKGTAIDPSHVYVGGATAVLIDLTQKLQSRIGLFIGAVILLAFLLLAMVFRSLYVPANAAVMNLLSIGASFGIVVAIFQWGWGKEIIGLTTTVPIVAFVPVMMFAVLFGLSMDYEVFLISRIKEEYDHNGADNRRAVVDGLAATARVITAAALIMISVFLSFVPNPDPTVKMIGFGMAVAVLLDATIVRMMLVPSTLELAGKATWWFPRWLDKILPRIHVE